MGCAPSTTLPPSISSTPRGTTLSRQREKYAILSQLNQELSPLVSTIIIGADLLLSPLLAAKDKEFIVQEIRVAEFLILMNSRKSVYRIDNAILAPTISDCDIGAIVNQCVQMLKLITNLKVKLTMDLNTPRFCRTDGTWLTDLLMHLLLNAHKFTPAGTIKIDVYRSNRYIKFSVSDTGVGVHENYRHQLFEAFNTGDSAFGLGIGLFTCRQRVHLLGGSIGYAANNHLRGHRPGSGAGAESSILPNTQQNDHKDSSEGSTFWLVIPFVKINLSVPTLMDYNLVQTHNSVIVHLLSIVIVSNNKVLQKQLVHAARRYTSNIVCAAKVCDAKDLQAVHCCIVEQGSCDKAYSEFTCFNGAVLMLPTPPQPTTRMCIEFVDEAICSTLNHFGFANVLILDDDRITNNLLTKMCEVSALKCTTTSTVQQAVSALGEKNEQKFSIVFININLPLLTTVDFLNAMTVAPESKPLIVLLTVENHDVKHPAVDAVIIKPALMVDIHIILQKMMSYRQCR